MFTSQRTIATKHFFVWLPFAAIATVCALTTFIVAQQTIRSSANDPQIQLAEDTALALQSGGAPQISGTQVDMSKSLAAFITVYDNSGSMVTSTAKLGGTVPVPPRGVFDYARAHGEERVTWEPERNVRIAAIVTHYNNGFVLAGRSLKEVEKRESSLGLITFVIWLVGLVGSFLVITFIPDNHV
ncbi:MAG: hypothetical protein NT003_04945 [Candidatus Magasanikbacteria bacterium]|nr:hypothetical protein [Candidatus Magasanikbacteria bacterium]